MQVLKRQGLEFSLLANITIKVFNFDDELFLILCIKSETLILFLIGKHLNSNLSAHHIHTCCVLISFLEHTFLEGRVLQTTKEVF